jgi:restriction system protein
MPVPKYYQFFPSILDCLADGKEHNLKEVAEYCANKFNLSDEDKRETLPSGQARYLTRLGWARTYLKKAGLIDRTSRSVYVITDLGEEAVRNGSSNVDLEYLRRFDSFNEFSNPKSTQPDNCVDINKKEESPQEQLELSIREINSSLCDSLMSELLKMSPYDFENLIVRLLIKMGYGTLKQNETAVTPKSGDEGIDGIVSADKFGFDSIYIQAKKWRSDTTVGRPEIQKFLGALAGQGATKGIFITTAHFSKEASAFAEKQLHQKIVLVDGNQLTELMIEYNLGVSVVETYVVKRVDYDFFNDEL